MREIQVRLEVDRVRNVVEAFDWKLTKEETGDGKVTITLEKEIELEEVTTDTSGS